MYNHLPASLLFLVAIFTMAASSAAENPTPGQQSHRSRGYNLQSVETLSGTVAAPEGKRRAPRGRVHLKTGKEDITVRLGPPWFLKKRGLTIKPDDKIEVTGSRITRQGRTYLLAAKVSASGKTVQLRDEKTGRPLWRNMRHRRPNLRAARRRALRHAKALKSTPAAARVTPAKPKSDTATDPSANTAPRAGNP